MFKSAVIKLTLYYLTIIMGLSLGFSFFLYHVSNNELNRGFREPTMVDYGFNAPANYELFRIDRISEAKDNLKVNFVIFNLVILLLGGFTSYFLAKRTLDPIEEAMESQSRFAADASHELRTPLTAMQTEIEVALRQKELSPKAAKTLLQSNLEEVVKLRGLSEALLRLAHQKDQPLSLKQVPADQLATDAINSVFAIAKAKRISINNQVKPTGIWVDAPAITETLVILLDNAIKFSPQKSSVTLTSKSTPKEFVISVKDEGVGIKPVDQPHVFDRFFRSDSSRHKSGDDGYGLGLSIAKQLVELHGGEISVQSIPKKGSTFAVSLPILDQ